MKLQKISQLSLFIASLIWFDLSLAQSVKIYDQPASAEEMGIILFSKPSVGKTRSIRFTPKENFQADLAKSVSRTEENNGVGLPIKFAYNSTRILRESIPFLNEVGKMLVMPEYANERLKIEGHTDAYGSKAYNLRLSIKRAAAVRNYLVSNFGITHERLMVDGMGEDYPLPGIDPYASVNRRVQFFRVSMAQ